MQTTRHTGHETLDHPSAHAAEHIATYRVTGMTCDHCVRSVTEEVEEIAGVTDVLVDLATGALTVTSTQPLSETAVTAAVDEAGYHLG